MASVWYQHAPSPLDRICCSVWLAFSAFAVFQVQLWQGVTIKRLFEAVINAAFLRQYATSGVFEYLVYCRTTDIVLPANAVTLTFSCVYDSQIASRSYGSSRVFLCSFISLLSRK